MVIRGAKEKTEQLRRASPTIDKDNIRLVLAVVTAYKWSIKSAAVKDAV